jgi:enoyl-CoA hydratase
MSYETLRVEVSAGGVGLVTLHRPEKLNAISIRMRDELSACLAAWRDEPAVRAVVFTGAGRAFSAGFELDEFKKPELHADILRSSSRYHRDLWSFPKPTIAAVNGLAVGGGFDLATLCDLRVAAEAAWFAHPELEHGAPPLYSPLRWIVGDGVARDLLLTRRRITAQDALALHLVREVVYDDGLLSAAQALAASIAAAPPGATAFLKARFAQSPGRGFEEAFAEEHDRAFREHLLVPGKWK